MRISAIIPAAGSGERLRKAWGKRLLPKAYLTLGDQPILGHTISQIAPVKEVKEIVVASPPGVRNLQRSFLPKNLKKTVKFVEGGKTRTDSVLNALEKVSSKTTHILIHDGVRPFVRTDTIRKLIKNLGKSKAIVLGRPMVPTVKEVRNGKVVKTLDRSHLWEIQTPQLYEKSLFKKAVGEFVKCPFPATDDASLIEKLGEVVKVFFSDDPNLKITTLSDWQMAEKLVAKSSEIRMGWGEDRHRLVNGIPLVLGGVRIPSSLGCQGHSDGDVVLHATIDAILGALGEGDIGEHFPDSDSRYRGMSSVRMLEQVLKKACGKGFQVNNVDVTVILERPKLSLWKKRIQRKLALGLGVPIDRVGIKAKTAEGLGPEGEGKAILAHAVVTLKKVS